MTQRDDIHLSTGFARPMTRLESVAAGATLGRFAAIALMASFVLTITVPLVVQLVYELWTEQTLHVVIDLPIPPTGRALAEYGNDLTRNSLLTKFIRHGRGEVTRPNFDYVPVTPGVDQFLFYKPEIEFVTGAGLLDPRFRAAPTIVPSIVDFHRQLARRGIRLIVFPIPAKTSIYPEKLWPAYLIASGSPLNADFNRWRDSLAASGVEVADLTQDFWLARNDSPDPLFDKTDTHWSSRGMMLAADKLAERVRPSIADQKRVQFTSRVDKGFLFGDLVELLGLPPANLVYPPLVGEHTVTLYNGAPAADVPDSSVLLIGDSYVEDHDNDGGFGQDLMLKLGVGVKTISVKTGESVNAVRKVIADDPVLLDGKKVVIWEFAARFLRSEEVHEWEKVPLPPPPSSATRP